MVGVQVNVPLVGVDTKVALFPGGSVERSAAKEDIASPSGSAAVTTTTTIEPREPSILFGAVRSGLRSEWNVAALSAGNPTVLTERVSAVEANALRANNAPTVPVVPPLMTSTGVAPGASDVCRETGAAKAAGTPGPAFAPGETVMPAQAVADGAFA